MSTTLLGLPVPRPGSAPAPTRSLTPSGRYRWRPDESALDVPVRELTLTDVRASLYDATEHALEALRDGRTADAAKYTRDAQLLCRAIRRFEVALARGEAGRT